MNFRKTVRSTYQNQSQHQSLKKIDFNADDLKQCNLYTQEAQSTKESDSNSILNRLLLQPPSMKQNSQKKLSLLQNKKYQPKFQKPDVENVIQQNINLKNIIQSNNHTISALKVKISEQEKKIKLLQKGLQKFEKKIFVSVENPKDKMQDEWRLQKQNEKKGSINEQKNMGMTQTGGSYLKAGTVHTEILKKKIADLTQQNVAAQNEISFLKKLPNATIYEQNDVQKQHLIAETIRLKSIITSLSEQLHQSMNDENNEKFQNQFMRLMKEENEKLKATVRLLENDKILLKSRQTIMNKLNSDLKKEIQQLKSRLLYKQSQLEKINNENKNLLFKKTNQFRQQQDRKQNEIIQQLRVKLSSAEKQISKLEHSNEFYNEENMALKQKEKSLQQQITETELKYQSLVKKLNQDIEQLQFQLSNVKNDYMSLLNANSLKKKKSVGMFMQPFNGQRRDSEFGKTDSMNSELKVEEQSNFNNPNCQSNNFGLRRQKSLASNLQIKDRVYLRPVKWQDIQLPLTHLQYALQDNHFLSIQQLFQNIADDNKIKCGDLISLFVDEPFNISKNQATKLARYIVQDEASANQKVIFDQKMTTQLSLAKRIISSSLQKISQKLSPDLNQKWRAIFDRTRKLEPMIKQLIENKEFVKKDELIRIIDRSSRQKVQIQEYDFLITNFFDRVHSEEEFCLNAKSLLQWINEITRPQIKSKQFENL